MHSTSYIPPGVNTPPPFDRLPLYKAVNGDDWALDFSLFNPVTKQPATMSNTVVTMIVTDNRFSDFAYWQGIWGRGLVPDARVPGLVHALIPKEVTSALRRGVYTYSVRVTDSETALSTTTHVGYIQVEYEATSPNHNIPYRERSSSLPYVTQDQLAQEVSALADTLAKGIESPEDSSTDAIISMLDKLSANLKAAQVHARSQDNA